MKRILLVALCFAQYYSSPLFATAVGEIAQDFVLEEFLIQENDEGVFNFLPQGDIKLSDFEGKVLVLDFFAWWCGPCKISSPIMVEQVEKHFDDNGGNVHGVPVSVLGVNIESLLPQNTDEFIETAGMEHVVNDTSKSVFDQFTVTDAKPLFVIINGVADSPSFDQWEVIGLSEGFPGAESIKSIVNQVEAGSGTPAPDFFTTDATDLGDQWYQHDGWFGVFYHQDTNWYFHETLGWVFISPEGNGGIWIYLGESIGWCWTSPTAEHPFLYQLSDTPSWIYYQLGSRNPRNFYHFSTQSWQPADE